MIVATSIASEETNIHSVIKDWAEAIRNKDADRVLSHHADGFIQFALAPPLQYGATNPLGKKGLEEWFASWKGLIGYEIDELKVVASETVAFAYSLNHMTGTKSNGEKSDLWFRVTLCFEKVGEAWMLRHEHDSVPFYMDGKAKAAIDLKP